MPRNVCYGSLADKVTSPRHVRFTPNNGRWTAHPSQHFGCAFMSALVDAGEETATCFANVATMMADGAQRVLRKATYVEQEPSLDNQSSLSNETRSSVGGFGEVPNCR